MNVDILRSKIINMAVQGKLVPQSIDDEPVSTLMEKINDKKGLHKTSPDSFTIYKDSDGHYYEKNGDEIKDISNEIECELPDSWCVCRLSDIANIYIGNSINKQEKKKKYMNHVNGYNYIGTKDVSFNHTVTYNNGVKIPYDTKFRIAHKGTPLLCIEGGSAGRKICILDEDVCFGNKLCAFESHGVDSKYLYYFLQSPHFTKVFVNNTTGLIGGVTKNNLAPIYFFMPPVAEQKRIVDKLESIFLQIEYIEKKQNSLIEEAENLENKIFDIAFRGGLVSQDSNDAPVNEIIKKIAIEKEKLRDGGKKQKDRCETIIYRGEGCHWYEKSHNTIVDITEEIPYAIPDSWTWGRLNNIVCINPIIKNISDDTEISFVDMSSIGEGYGSNYTHEIRPWGSVKKGYTHFCENDVGLAKISPCFQNKKSVVFTNLKNGYGAGTTELHILRIIPETIDPKYLLFFLQSPYFIQNGSQIFSGIVGQQRFDSDELKNTLIPIPPFAEQKRIVAKLEKYDGMFQELKNISQ